VILADQKAVKLEGAVNPNEQRIRAIYDRCVEKLKDVVHEFKITEDELHAAGDYLDRLGQSGMSRSLIVVALGMTAIDVAGHSRKGTRFNLTGPYHAAHGIRRDGNLLDVEPEPGAPRLLLEGVVTDASTGQPLAGAELDFWHADHKGIYDRKGQHLRGIVPTDANGRYSLRTLLPNDYSEHDYDPLGELFRAMGRTNTRAAHVHLKVRFAEAELLTTQIFMSTSTMLRNDYVEGAVSDDLVVVLDKREIDGVQTFSGHFDISVVVPETVHA
jgi:protocatechuate 3,4-dioxygenase beta subunit